MRRVTPAEYQAMRRGRPRAARGNKYGAQKARIGGMIFDSRGERDRYVDLARLEAAGEISDLERQVSIPLVGRDGPLKGKSGRPLHYIADFAYREAGQLIYEDFKGAETEVFKLKRAILAAQGIHLRITQNRRRR